MLARKETYNIAIVGATGAVGEELRDVLVQRGFPVGQVRLLASARSAGKTLTFGEQKIAVEELTESSFDGIDIALFSAGASRSKEFAPYAVASGAVVVDNSSAFRMDEGVPLVVPEVNGDELLSHDGIIANPNCSTIQMVMALKPIHDMATISRVVVSTYQAVSGTGQAAIEELVQQTGEVLNLKEPTPKVYPHQIAFNCLPHIDVFDDAGTTREEWKMIVETQKILGDDSIRITATTVRVPVFRAHAESINLELERPLSANQARALLSDMPGVVVLDDPERNLYPLPVDVSGSDAVYVGRVREDPTLENGLNMWVVADQLRKGAALNAVQIAEQLIRTA